MCETFDVKAGKHRCVSVQASRKERVGGDTTFHHALDDRLQRAVLTSPHYTSGLFVQTVLLKTGVLLRFHFFLKGGKQFCLEWLVILQEERLHY